VFYLNQQEHDELQYKFKRGFKNPLNIEFVDSEDGIYEYQINTLTIPKMNIGEKIIFTDLEINLIITNVEFFYLQHAPHESYFMYECKTF